MTNTRYMIVEHKREDSELMIIGGKVMGRIAIHGLLTNYHWFRLDEVHVLLLGTFSVAHSKTLREHSKVSMLPHINSNKPLKDHLNMLGRDHHYSAMSAKLGTQDTHTMADMLDTIEEQAGPAFAPVR